MTTIYLERANTDLICYCHCERSLVGSPMQLDCPWCGCGWLFNCMECHKAYAFARGVEIEQSLEQLAEIDLRGKSKKPATAQSIADWVEWMKILLKVVLPGETYAYIDGWYLPIHSAPVQFEGWHARHHLPAVPQFQALTDPAALRDTLESPRYWQSNAIDQKGGV
jgi:hypothetical protein